ncbi:MAG TPA: hypothetical protein VNH83_20730 [Bryobacteraceae bacterium]|jgi:hypothetical protein|nr:hypothetical protein [Bryobacteraceae bacterium]
MTAKAVTVSLAVKTETVALSRIEISPDGTVNKPAETATVQPGTTTTSETVSKTNLEVASQYMDNQPAASEEPVAQAAGFVSCPQLWHP